MDLIALRIEVCIEVCGGDLFGDESLDDAVRSNETLDLFDVRESVLCCCSGTPSTATSAYGLLSLDEYDDG